MHGIAAYNRTTTNAAPNEQILLMLLEQAIRNQNRAIASMEEGNRSAWSAEIHNCRAIFLELVGAIDAEIAPEIAKNLQQTYGWCLHHLQEANKVGNAEQVRSVLRVTELLHSTWIQAVQKWYEENATPEMER
jgi:flagellar biosynthetic protein FliS